MTKFLQICAALLVVLALWPAYTVYHLWGSHPPPRWDAASLAALTAELSDADGKPAPAHALDAARRVLVYFSASWCPPCQEFTPQLVAWYHAHSDGRTLPLLFVSYDRDAAAMRQHMSDDHMPWWGVAFGSDSAKDLTQAYGATAIPVLVLLDDHGRVLSDSVAGGFSFDPQPVLTAALAGR